MWSPPSAAVLIQWDEEPFVAAQAFEVASAEKEHACSGKPGCSSPETEATATPDTSIAGTPHGWSTPTYCFSSPTSATSSADEKEPSSPTGSEDEKDAQQAEARLSIVHTPKEEKLQRQQSSEDQGSTTTASSEETAPPVTTRNRQSMVGLAGVMLMLTSTSIGAAGACVPAKKPAKPASAEDARTATKLVAKCVQLLLSCGYPWEEVELIGAIASSYMERLLQGLRESGRPEMELMERAHVLCLLMFLAHSYVEDEHCPAKYWHQRLFLKYCDMRTMNAAILSLLQNSPTGCTWRRRSWSSGSACSGGSRRHE